MSRAGKRLLTEETGERIAEALEGISAPVAVEEALAIVCNGDTAPANIASGKYLFIKNHSTLPAGGYHATAAISAGDTLDLSNVEPDEEGIANSLSEQIGNKLIVTTENIVFSNNNFGAVPSKPGYTFVTAFPDTAGYSFVGYYYNGASVYITAPNAISATIKAKVIWFKDS